MFQRQLLILFLVAAPAAFAADEPTMGPVIENYGPVYDVPELDVALPTDRDYKIVFDIASDPSPGTVNRNFVSVARYLNMHARNGVPAERMHVAIVLHGPAVKNLLRQGDNPNLGLISELQAAGVRVYVCGQSVAHAGLAKADLADGVNIALSAMTMLTILQADGYSLLPWGAS